VCFLTLDPNTANTQLILSEENRSVTGVEEKQSYPDHPDRFDVCQVLCRESVCGRCYWEIECSGDDVLISVSYKSISRKGWGDECEFGCNDQSWSLDCSLDSYSITHNNILTELAVDDDDYINRVGVSDDDDEDDDDDDYINRVGVSDDDDDEDEDDDDDDDYIYRIGVYVDESAGTLSFYSVSRNTMSLIHTEQITFTQPLYPGFYVGSGSSVKLC
ncbi:hypothetical protein M9458_009021, partial [Cirrhinus mrigala]